MNAKHKLLLAVIALELGLIASRFIFATALPRMDWQTTEPATVRDIEAVETRRASGTPDDWFELGETYRTFGFFPEAEYCYRKSDSLVPSRPVVLYCIAVTLDLLGRTAEATAGYRKVLQLLEDNEGIVTKPYDPTVLGQYCWLRIGEDKLREENPVEAEKALLNASLLPKARLLLARMYYRSGRADEASQLMDEMVEQFPGFMDFAQMKSWAEAELGRIDNARAFDNLALRNDKRPPLWDLTYPEVRERRDKFGSLRWYNLSQQAAAKGLDKEAHELAQRAVTSMWTEEYAQQLAALDLKGNSSKRAIELLKQSLFHTGGNAAGFVLLGEARLQSGDIAKALESWQFADQFEPDSSQRSRMAVGYQKLGDAAEARRQTGLGHYQAGKTLWLKNDLAPAAARFEEASRVLPDHAHTWFYLGEIRRLQGDKLGAETAYRRCLVINPNHGRALRAVGLLR